MPAIVADAACGSPDGDLVGSDDELRKFEAAYGGHPGSEQAASVHQYLKRRADLARLRTSCMAVQVTRLTAYPSRQRLLSSNCAAAVS